MINISNEVKVTLTIVTAIIAAFLGFRVMNDMPIFRQSQKAITYFNRVDGLSAGSYVYLNGVKVGSVERIRLVDADSVKVTMNFNLGVNIPRNSTAYLESSGLLDEKAIIIERGDSPDHIAYADTLKGIYREGITETLKNEGEKLSDDFSQSFEKLNMLLERLNNVASENNQVKINDVLSGMQDASKELAGLFQEKRSDLESSIDHAHRFLANLDTVSTTNKSRIDSALAGFEKSLAEVERLSRELNKTNTTLNEILVKIDRGEGTLGKLVNDPSLYDNLDSLSVEMKLLITNIQDNPKKYLKNMKLIEVF